MVNVYLNEVWRSAGRISASSQAGTKTAGAIKDTCFTRAMQAIMLKTDE
jgi:hypothetical protein